MRTKVTLILLFLNVALFFFIFKFERPWRIDERSREARSRVLGPEAANIQSLKISYAATNQSVSLVKRNDGWYLTEPFAWPANGFAVNRILNDLQLLEHKTSFAVADLPKNNLSLADYGLDKPSITVTFTSADPSDAKTTVATGTLLLGNKSNAGNLLYVLSPDGARVHVVGRSIADSLAQTPDQLRSETLFSIAVWEVRSFNLTFLPANLRIRLQRQGNRWQFAAPVEARASKTTTEVAINDLGHLQVKSFLTTPPADPSRLANPTMRISLEGNNRTETLVLYSPVSTAPAGASSPTTPPPDTEYYARMEGKLEGATQTFTVAIPGELKAALDQAQTKLRERTLLDFDAHAVTAVTLSAPNQSEVTLARDITALPALDPANPAKAAVTADAPWQLVRREGTQAPQTQPADARTVQHLLDNLARLSAKNFPSDAPTTEDLETWGFNRPERVITLTLAGAPNTAAQTIKLELGVGAQRGSSVFARVSGSASIYEVDAEILRELPVQPLVFRDRLLRELPAGAQITHLRLIESATKAVIFDQQTAGAEPKNVTVQKLIEQLRTLRAKAFLADQFSPSILINGEERPWKYELTADISLVGGAAGAQTSTTSLFLSDRIGGTTQYAGSPEFGATWEVEQPFLDALWELAYGKRDPGPPAELFTAPATTPAPAAKP